ncbi:hypothetical protein WD019_09465 [Fictibacillus sp. Mic-4]|uniref:hypothetical protein n=1 Tax=Fictibacillus sp. Mic-4 TaxID=3132826 RepID=UPI003CF32640
MSLLKHSQKEQQKDAETKTKARITTVPQFASTKSLLDQNRKLRKRLATKF